MYRVIIAEDEDIIRKGLVYLPWADMECTVVGEACNGVEGVDLIRRLHPDIVLADINMPVLDGLDMIKETYRECVYSAIILSGYSEFEYARTAIQYGATGYLLKPLKTAELTKAVEEAKEQCQIRHSWQDRLRESEELKQTNLLPENYGEDKVVLAMLQYIREHYREKLTMQDVTAELNYSETFLNKRFKKQMGTTFNEYLNRFRIQKAMELLKAGELSISDVSWECGIRDYKYFNVVFRKYVGCSPKEYAARVSKKGQGI